MATKDETQQTLDATEELKKELYKSHQAIASKLDTMQNNITAIKKDITTIQENIKFVASQRSEEITALKARVTRIEKHLGLSPLSAH